MYHIIYDNNPNSAMQYWETDANKIVFGVTSQTLCNDPLKIRECCCGVDWPLHLLQRKAVRGVRCGVALRFELRPSASSFLFRCHLSVGGKCVTSWGAEVQNQSILIMSVPIRSRGRSVFV